jgi:hypothetical protein
MTHASALIGGQMLVLVGQQRERKPQLRISPKVDGSMTPRRSPGKCGGIRRASSPKVHRFDYFSENIHNAEHKERYREGQCDRSMPIVHTEIVERP